MTLKNNKDSLVQFMDTSNWDNICDFTLNIKQALNYDGTLVHIDEITARKALKWFWSAPIRWSNLNVNAWLAFGLLE